MALANVTRNLISPTSFYGEKDGRTYVHNRQHTDYYRLRDVDSRDDTGTGTTVNDTIWHVRGPLTCMLYPLTASQPFGCIENVGTPIFGSAYQAVHPLDANPQDDLKQDTTVTQHLSFPRAVTPNLDLYSTLYTRQFVESTKFKIKVTNGDVCDFDVGYALLPQRVALIGGDSVQIDKHGGLPAGTDVSGMSIDKIFAQPFVYKLGHIKGARIREGQTYDRTVTTGAHTAGFKGTSRTDSVSRTFQFEIDNVAILNALAYKKTGHATAPVDYHDTYSTSTVGSHNPSGVYDLCVQFFIIPSDGNRVDYQGSRVLTDDLHEGGQVEYWNVSGSLNKVSPWSRLVTVDLSCTQRLRYLDPKRTLDNISNPTFMS